MPYPSPAPATGQTFGMLTNTHYHKWITMICKTNCSVLVLNCVSLCTLYHYVYSDGKMWFCFICDTAMCTNPYRLDGPH